MSSTATDRRFGVNASKAVKVPCVAATTAAITLSGEQTIDGVACVTDDRVLVWNQASAIDNGIWTVATGTWSRAVDCDDQYDLTKGSQVYITGGTSYANHSFYCASSGTIVPGTSSINFAVLVASGLDFVEFDSFAAAMAADLSVYDSVKTTGFYGGWAATVAGPKGGAAYHRDGTTGAASTAYSDNSGFYDANGDGFTISLTGEGFNVYQFGALGDGVTSDTTYVDYASAYVEALGGGTLHFPPGNFLGNFAGRTNVRFLGAAPGKLLAATLMPTTLTAAATGATITGSSVRGFTVENMGFEGLGASIALVGIDLTNGDYCRVINCGFDNFADQAILTDSTSGACWFIDNFAQNCLLDRSRAAKSGVIQIAGNDNYIVRGEYSPSLSALTDANKYVGAILIESTAGNTSLEGMVVGEFGDFGIRDEGINTKANGPRADLNWGHGFEIAGDHFQGSNLLALNNGQETTDTYDGFSVESGAAYPRMASCTAVSLGAITNKHRYGFNDANTSLAQISRYGASNGSFGHATAAFNAIATGGASINNELSGVGADAGDAAFSYTAGTSRDIIYYNTPITADRAVTLNTANAVNGSKVRVVRTAACTGAFNINVGTGPLKAMGTAGTFSDYAYTGSAWILTGSGTL